MRLWQYIFVFLVLRKLSDSSVEYTVFSLFIKNDSLNLISVIRIVMTTLLCNILLSLKAVKVLHLYSLESDYFLNIEIKCKNTTRINSLRYVASIQ